MPLVDDAQGGQASGLTSKLGGRKGTGVAAGWWDGLEGTLLWSSQAPDQDSLLNPHHTDQA